MGRREHLQEHLNKDYELLKNLEDRLRTETDPRLELRWTEDINKVKLRIRQHEEELRSLPVSSVQPEPIPPETLPPEPKPVVITRKRFLQWAGLGGAGLVTVVVANEIFKGQSPTLDSFKFETVTVDQKGEIVERDSNKQAKFFEEDLGNGVTLEMVSISGGKFLMGTEDEEIERLVKTFDWGEFRREKPQHEVTVQPFFMGKFQVTQAQWRAIASLPKVNHDLKPDPSGFNGDDRPVEQVSWFDAVEFCERLSRLTEREYRLPSEAEWEYACRAGTTTPFHFGETITWELANYNARRTYAQEPKGEKGGETIPVGSFPPNAFGLYDMHGNVWEWCADNWHDNYEGAPTDGSAWTEGGDDNSSLLRGGSWYAYPNRCRSAKRDDPPYSNAYPTRGFRIFDVGFRVVCVAPRT